MKLINLKLMKIEDEVIMKISKIPGLLQQEILVETITNILKTWQCKCRSLFSHTTRSGFET
jgi:hypothetical protein